MWFELSLPWQTAIQQAWQAYCDGSVPIGAVITAPDGQIVAQARNHIHDQNAPSGQIHQTTLAHAEMNALLQIDRKVVDTRTSTLYTTMEPCPLCMGAIYMMSIKNVYFAARDPYAGSTNQLGKTPYLSRKTIHIRGPQSNQVEDILIAIQTVFHIRLMQSKRPDTLQAVLDDWEASIPHGVRLGREIYESGFLSTAVDQKWSAMQVLQALHEMLVKSGK
jgi:tRNA(adenine34) deaminase